MHPLHASFLSEEVSQYIPPSKSSKWKPSVSAASNHVEFHVSQFYTTWVRHGPVGHFLFSIVSSFRLFTGLVFSPCTTTGSAFLFSTSVLKCGQRAPALLYDLRSKRLLRPRASPVPGATSTASTFSCQWRPAGRLDLSPRPALLLVLHSRFKLRSSSVPSVQLHCSTVCAPKDYFGHEHHLFQERLLLLLHSLASGVLLVDWTCLLALHYYWFCIPVLNFGPQVCSAVTCTALRSALHKITSAMSNTCSRSDLYCFYILLPVASCW
ncbi:uncharacterized protein [Dermacentor albipictus]|uniref:uncharacterized protein n=1 Tax=Dermacentor albipictus TaxID=60249 RepID=UPI0038FD20D1